MCGKVQAASRWVADRRNFLKESTKRKNGKRNRQWTEHTPTCTSGRNSTNGKQSGRQASQLCQNGIICRGGGATSSQTNCVPRVLYHWILVHSQSHAKGVGKACRTHLWRGKFATTCRACKEIWSKHWCRIDRGRRERSFL